MAVIKWNDKLNTGIRIIDDQHKILVEMINNFYDGINDKSNDELISDLITKMKDYTMVHFSTEEELLRKHGYSDYDNHKKQHDAFVLKVQDLEKRFKDGTIILSFEITKFLKDWLLDHIQGTDMKYAKVLVQKGVK